ncbi:hypothetical protein J5N97_017405 [Dioscorea zingiberensis]|uniref:Uncharacterized protein n=1 Tax=Dioscorea zingiberensis TaxID=325984 RepID=A0A9D5CLM3_9LILI|nr:hypothetical protein J5N97_017405 [Dioscorea zingiberensis]
MELNRVEVLREGPNSGVRVFLDEDQESYFDLSVERLPDSELFEVQISFSSPSEVDKDKGIFASEDHVGTVENLLNQIRPDDQQALLEDSNEILSHVSCLELKICSGFRPSSFGVDDGLFSCKPRGQKQKSLRKPSKLASVIHDRVARFIVKFPSKKVGNTFMSALRSFTYKGLKSDNLLEKNTSSSRFVFPLNKWMSSRKRMKVNDSSSSRPSFSQNKGNSSAGCLRSGNRFMNFRSCPSSIMSSPSHGFYKDRGIFERDCAINAAIAHCKLSFHGANSNSER